VNRRHRYARRQDGSGKGGERKTVQSNLVLGETTGGRLPTRNMARLQENGNGWRLELIEEIKILGDDRM